MKKYILFLLIVSLVALPAFGETYYLRGTHNDWGTSGGELAAKSIGGGTFYGLTIAAADSGKFKIANSDWSKQWAGNVSSFDAITNMTWYGSDAFWLSPTQNYVHISVHDPDSHNNSNLSVGVMALSSNTLTSIDSLKDNSTATASENDTVTVTLYTSQTLMNEEKLYVRYTEDNWSSSKAVKASGSGTTYTADIVSGIKDTLSYYAFTSTLDWDTSSNLRENTDLLTLKANTNSGSNYRYVVEGNSAPVIASVSDQTIEEGDTLKLTITATDVNDDPLTWSASGFGTGIDTATVNGDFIITFTPDYTEAGRVDTITVSVSDGKSATTNSIAIDKRNKNSNK